MGEKNIQIIIASIFVGFILGFFFRSSDYFDNKNYPITDNDSKWIEEFVENSFTEEQSLQSSTKNQIPQTSDIKNDIIKFLGENYKLYETEDINNGSAYYYSLGDFNDALIPEIIINIYDDDIKAEDLANDVTESMKKNGNKLYQPFISPDKNNKDAFYITSLQINLPTNPNADIFIMKVFNVERTYMIIYRKTIPGIVKWMLEEEADDWLIENIEVYGKEIDEINPLSISINED